MASDPSFLAPHYFVLFAFCLFRILPDLSVGFLLKSHAVSRRRCLTVLGGEGSTERNEASFCRRDFFASVCTSAIGATSAIAASSAGPRNAEAVSQSAASNVPEVDFRAVASDIEELIAKVPYRGPPLVRLAWHSSGTFDLASGTGGSEGGTIRFQEELAHKENVGLAQPVKWLEKIKKKYGEGLSYADLYTLAGVVAIKVMGGPSIPWSCGRGDAPDSSSVTSDGRLPGADTGRPGFDKSDSRHLRAIFGRMGFDDREIVALSGAHSLGRCNKWASGYDGTWTTDPIFFDNSYFVLLQSLRWQQKKWDGPFQYEARAGGKTLVMLPTDLALLRDPSFRKYVRLYAKDRSQFENDFSAAFQKLEELGTEGLMSVNLWA